MATPLMLLAFVASLPAEASCTTEAMALTCGSEVSGALDPGPWIGDGRPDPHRDEGWLNQQAYGNDMGANCFWTLDEDPTGPRTWTCPEEGRYSGGGPVSKSQEGPEDIYSFTCQRDGLVEVQLTNDCDMDLYVLDSDCAAESCLAEATGWSGADDSVVFDCTVGETYHIVVEGNGFTNGAFEEYYEAYVDVGLPVSNAWCYSNVPGRNGEYSLSFVVGDEALLGCAEVCDNGTDDDGDGLADCADPLCASDPVCLPDEICDNGIDDSGNGAVDCEDPTCFEDEVCCDDDGDGFLDVACGGTDCADGAFDLDVDFDGVPDRCDLCPTVMDLEQLDSDGDGVGDACDVCAYDSDPFQIDHDGDGVGDVCDTCPDGDNSEDRDFDGVPDLCDACPDEADEDLDGDGDPSCVDCDDTNALLHSLDVDGDGVTACDGDCHDFDASVYPGAVETADYLDNDCNGLIDEGTTMSDDDGDGFTELGGDCDDSSPDVGPTVVEICNDVDDDCDGIVDNNTSCYDDDGDGFSEDDGDCNDVNPMIYPDAYEVPFNGIDDDCDGVSDGQSPDLDGDGYSELAGDCAPTNPRIYPDATELADGLDNDCDGIIDEDTVRYDDDGDGYSENEGDCHDGDADVHPGVVEDLGDGVDEDCDGIVDEDGAYVDSDGDGIPVGMGDCDDTDASVHQYADEKPFNGIDDDCDGRIDEAVDEDGDGLTPSAGDCDDTDGWVHPDAVEFCDRIDNDCDGKVDEGCRTPRPSEASARACGTIPGAASPLWLFALAFLRRRRNS